MNYIDKYKHRVTAYGNDIRESILNNTSMSLDSMFVDNPAYRQVIINDMSIDCLFNKTKKYNEKQLLFKPGTDYEVGTLINVGDQNYLTIDFEADEVYPHATIQLCNNILRVKMPSEKTITGHRSNGDPIYKIVPQPPYETPCIINDWNPSLTNTLSQAINYADTDVSLTIQNKQGLSDLIFDKDFEMLGNNYHIYGFQQYKTIRDDGGLLIVLAHNKATESSDAS